MKINLTTDGASKIKSYVKFDSITMNFPNNRVEFRLNETVVGVIQICVRESDTLTVGNIKGKFEIQELKII